MITCDISPNNQHHSMNNTCHILNLHQKVNASMTIKVTHVYNVFTILIDITQIKFDAFDYVKSVIYFSFVCPNISRQFLSLVAKCSQ